MKIGFVSSGMYLDIIHQMVETEFSHIDVIYFTYDNYIGAPALLEEHQSECDAVIFSGNLARIGAVRDVLGVLVNKNTLLFSVLSCQVISNVPSAILLSHFTTNYPALLIGVNIGGAGTLIASLASLITLGQYSKYEPYKVKHYILQFSLYNFSMLAILTAVMLFVL